MFCPQCSTHNLDGAKFCRVCGTNLEIVSMALAGQLTTPPQNALAHIGTGQDPLAKKRVGLRDVVQGSILLGVSLFIALAGFVLTRGRFPWLFFWSIFFGWMACWGTISLAMGLGRLIEAKVTGSSQPEVYLPTAPYSEISGETLPRTSVTDHTTRQLGQKNMSA